MEPETDYFSGTNSGDLLVGSAPLWHYLGFDLAGQIDDGANSIDEHSIMRTKIVSQSSCASRLIVNFETYPFGFLVSKRFTLLTIPLLSMFPAR